MDNKIRKMDIRKIEKFLRESAYSPTTITAYRYALHRIGAFLAVRGREWEDLGPELMIEFLDRQDWGVAMRSQVQQAARALISHFYGKDHPIFDLPLKKAKPKPQKTLSEAEFLRLLDSIDVSRPQGLRNYAMLVVMLDTGIRSAEVCRLELKHLSLEDRSFRVKTKGGAFRTKIYSDLTSAILAEWLDIRRDHARPGVGNVFIGIRGTTPGENLTPSGLRTIFRKMGKKAGIEPFSPHVMRRTFATLATIYGAPAVVLQKAGGWSDIGTMSIYTQAVPTRTIESYLPTARLLNRQSGEEVGGEVEEEVRDDVSWAWLD